MLTKAEREKRKNGLGSSDIAVACGLNPWRFPINLYSDKIDKIVREEIKNWKAKIGHQVEQPIAEDWAEQLGIVRLIPGETMVHPSEPWIMATPDYWGDFPDDRPQRMCECKNVGWRVAHHWTDGPPAYVECQVHWQQIVTGCEFTDVAASIANEAPEIWNVPFDTGIHEALIEIGKDFWFEHVLKEIPPSPDDSAQYAEFLAERYQKHGRKLVQAPADAADWIRQRQSALETIRNAERAQTEAENHIKAMIGRNAGIWSESFRATWTSTKGGGVDWKSLALSMKPTREQIENFRRPGHRTLNVKETR
jgi:putative phage-type endonuclease